MSRRSTQHPASYSARYSARYDDPAEYPTEYDLAEYDPAEYGSAEYGPAEQREQPARSRRRSWSATGRHAAPARHRKRSRVMVRVAAVVMTAAAAALLAMRSGAGGPSSGDPAALGRSATLSPYGPSGQLNQPASGRGGVTGANDRGVGLGGQHVSPGQVGRTHRRRRARTGAAAFYRNPVRAITGLLPERVDMGADFGGTGPIYALGDAVITSAVSGTPGWPGGGWITYRLTKGPAAGLEVFVAEDVTPTVRVGQTVTSSTVIATMFNGSAGIETGWAQPGTGFTESQSAAAGGISGGGPFPTVIGLNFDHLLEALGVPAGIYADLPGHGLLPPGYPARW